MNNTYFSEMYNNQLFFLRHGHIWGLKKILLQIVQKVVVKALKESWWFCMLLGVKTQMWHHVKEISLWSLEYKYRVCAENGGVWFLSVHQFWMSWNCGMHLCQQAQKNMLLSNECKHGPWKRKSVWSIGQYRNKTTIKLGLKRKSTP